MVMSQIELNQIVILECWEFGVDLFVVEFFDTLRRVASIGLAHLGQSWCGVSNECVTRCVVAHALSMLLPVTVVGTVGPDPDGEVHGKLNGNVPRSLLCSLSIVEDLLVNRQSQLVRHIANRGEVKEVTLS